MESVIHEKGQLFEVKGALSGTWRSGAGPLCPPPITGSATSVHKERTKRIPFIWCNWSCYVKFSWNHYSAICFHLFTFLSLELDDVILRLILLFCLSCVDRLISGLWQCGGGGEWRFSPWILFGPLLHSMPFGYSVATEQDFNTSGAKSNLKSRELPTLLTTHFLYDYWF